jgi:hypothetical protein
LSSADFINNVCFYLSLFTAIHNALLLFSVNSLINASISLFLCS